MLQLRRHLTRLRDNDILKSILYHDKAVIVLNKPAGMIAQGGPPRPERRLHTDLSQVLEEVKSALGLFRTPYPVHRLDQGTTGCLILAKTLPGARDLSQQFNRRVLPTKGDATTVDKRYFALVQNVNLGASGEIRTPMINNDGRMSAALAHTAKPSAENKNKGTRKEAATDWRLLHTSHSHELSLLELHLLTGVKHQLRVHLAQCLNAPILGDLTYNQKSKPGGSDLNALKLQAHYMCMFLHARELSFLRYMSKGPHRQVRVTVAAPLPAPFLAACEEVGVKIQDEWVHGAVRLRAHEATQERMPVKHVVQSLRGHVGEGMLCSYEPAI